MKVSIVVNNYNYASFLAASVDSAIDQSWDDVEVIVVDDGSTDKSRDILESYRDRVKLIFKENGGQGSALNLGFRASSGDIVIFLDADDVLSRNCVETILPKFTEGVTKVHFNLEVIDGSGERLEPLFHKAILPEGDLLDETLDTGLVDSMPMSGNAFRRSFLENVFPMKEGHWRRSADVYLFNLATLYGKVAAINEALGSYRIHGHNVSKNIEGGRLNRNRIKQLLDRNIRMDQYLARFAKKLGHTYKRGKLLTDSSHAQLQVIAHASAAPGMRTRLQKRLASYVTFVAALSKNNLSLHKAFAIALVSFFIVIAPHRTAERLCVMSYRLGMVLSSSKIVQNMKA